MSQSDKLTGEPIVCEGENCGRVIKEGETFFWEDGKIFCPKCYEEYLKLKESKRTEATGLEGYL